MSAHVILNLLKEVSKRDKLRGLLGILSEFIKQVEEKR